LQQVKEAMVYGITMAKTRIENGVASQPGSNTTLESQYAHDSYRNAVVAGGVDFHSWHA
jgi:hypothetical protein